MEKYSSPCLNSLVKLATRYSLQAPIIALNLRRFSYFGAGAQRAYSQQITLADRPHYDRVSISI